MEPEGNRAKFRSNRDWGALPVSPSVAKIEQESERGRAYRSWKPRRERMSARGGRGRGGIWAAGGGGGGGHEHEERKRRIREGREANMSSPPTYAFLGCKT